MADLVVITPTRGRPKQFAEMVHAVGSTARGSVTVLGCVDDDDPDLDTYLGMARGDVHIIHGPRRSLSAWTNEAARGPLLAPDAPRYLASLGDDHRPRTPGWDRQLVEAVEKLPGPGIAYGNDLFQGHNVPTAWVMSAELVRALGWMMLPACEHLYVDNAIRELGSETGRIAYVPQAVIEHLHPAAGKGAWDDSYRQSNRAEQFQRDHDAYYRWIGNGGLAADVEKVLATRWT